MNTPALLDPFPYAERAFLHVFQRAGSERIELLWQLGSLALLTLLIGLTAGACFGWGLVRKRAWLHSDVFFMTTVALSLLLIRLPGIFSGPQFPTDEEEWMACAATLVDNPRFWLAVDASTSGPLVVYPLVVIHYLGASLSDLSVRLFLVLGVLIPALLLVYRALVNAFGVGVARLALLPGLVALCFASGPGNYISTPYNGEHVPMLLFALGLLLYVRLFIQRTGNLVHLTLLGTVLGMLPFAKLQSVPLGLVLGVAALLNGWAGSKRLRDMGFLLFGAVFPALLVAVYLTTAGAWPDFWASYIQNNLTYATQAGLNAARPPLGEVVQSTLVFFGSVLEFSSLIYLGSILLLSVPFGYRVFLRRLSLPQQQGLLLGWWLMLAALEGVIQPMSFFGHYQFLLILPIIFLLGATLETAWSLFVGSKKALFVLLTTAFVGYSAGVCLLRGVDENPATGQTDEVSVAIARYGRPGQKLAVWGYANTLYLRSQMIMGTRNAHTYYQLNGRTGQASYYLDRYVRDLRQQRPPVFVDAVSPDFESTLSFRKSLLDRRIEQFPTLHRFVATHYSLKETIRGVRIFVLNGQQAPIRLSPNSP